MLSTSSSHCGQESQMLRYLQAASAFKTTLVLSNQTPRPWKKLLAVSKHAKPPTPPPVLLSKSSDWLSHTSPLAWCAVLPLNVFPLPPISLPPPRLVTTPLAVALTCSHHLCHLSGRRCSAHLTTVCMSHPTTALPLRLTASTAPRCVQHATLCAAHRVAAVLPSPVKRGLSPQ